MTIALNEYGEGAFEINYCPICGRKLVDQWKSMLEATCMKWATSSLMEFWRLRAKQFRLEFMRSAKKGVAILLKETYSTHEELKKAVSGYAMKGFKVYYNEHGRSNWEHRKRYVARFGEPKHTGKPAGNDWLYDSRRRAKFTAYLWKNIWELFFKSAVLSENSMPEELRRAVEEALKKRYCSTCRHYINRDGECCNAEFWLLPWIQRI